MKLSVDSQIFILFTRLPSLYLFLISKFEPNAFYDAFWNIRKTKYYSLKFKFMPGETMKLVSSDNTNNNLCFFVIKIG